MRSALALLLCACAGGWKLPDGGTLPDAGDGCPCADVQTQIWGDGELLLECVPHNAGVVGLCFGDGCCTWEP